MVPVDSPWVKNPFPRSVVQPNAYRVVKWLRRPTYLPSNYPYRDHPEKASMIPYHEWRGQGSPPNDVGYPGDVYINMTPGKYSLYGRTKKGWEIWNGLCYEKWQLVPHPHLDDRYLFCSEADIKWYSLDAIRAVRRQRDNSLSSSKAIESVRAQENVDKDQSYSSRPGKRKKVEEDTDEDVEQDEDEEQLDRLSENSGSGRQARVEFLEEEVHSLKQQNAGLRRDDEYRAMSFDDLCLRVRTSDQRVATAQQCRTIIENALKAELNTAKETAKATDAKLETAVKRVTELEVELEEVKKSRRKASIAKGFMQAERDIAQKKLDATEAKYNDLKLKLGQLLTG